MNFEKLEKKEREKKVWPELKVKKFLLKRYGYDPDSTKDLERELVVTPCIDTHGRIYTVVLSMDGSPPKGVIVINGLGNRSIPEMWATGMMHGMTRVRGEETILGIVGFVLKRFTEKNIKPNNLI